MREESISEYGYIYFEKPKNLDKKFIHKQIEEEEFDELFEYWKENANAKKVFEYDGYKYLKAQNYVGIIQTKNLSVEILPKIFNKTKQKDLRIIFTEMLKPLLNINEIEINKANLSVTKNKNIYEMFISMFITYLDILIHKGLKSQYISKEENQFFLKGKLKFNNHIKQNYIHKERFYVEFDEYMQDRIENRLLKSTVQLLLKKTNDYENKRALRQQLFIFDEVQLSTNYDIDISKINLHRGMEYYEMPLRFARVFLKYQSFTSLRGKDNVFALLFPMEKVFENYIEFVLNNSKDILGIEDVIVNGGKNEYLLSNGNCNMARLQPDYLIKMRDGREIVTDAKWKLLEAKENETKNCDTINISSGDVYQIFSYLHFYDCENTGFLFVPEIDDSTLKNLDNKVFTYLEKNNPLRPSEKKKIQVITVDLNKLINEKPTHRLKVNPFVEIKK